ncbi:hypothetical protein GOP47_0030130 [Adiantum capillus-veneris]|nr:hypothetical protein GOP47_0030130 [Adiantum capillus-veneris]
MQARAIFTQIRNRAAGAIDLAPSNQVCRLRYNASSRQSTRPSTSRTNFARVFCSSASMETSLETGKTKWTRVIEHIVLLKVKESASAEQQDALISGLRSLKCLPMVIELSAGKVVQSTCEPYTHALHCRCMSKEDLTSYANDPYHLDVINKYIVPIVEDRLALDWEADVEDPILHSSSYGAVRIATMKPKQSLGSEELSSVMDVLREHKRLLPIIKQVSVGKNFSPARAKDYEWAYLAVFPSPNVLKESKELEGLHAQVASAMEKINVVDYYTA